MNVLRLSLILLISIGSVYSWAQEEVQRPQTPTPPFDYRIDSFTVHNPIVDISLSGTLTRPEGDGPWPLVVLVTGSGPQDRNSTLMNHQPFWVWADYLTSNGVAVMRYDERGVGLSTGSYMSATSLDLAQDVEVMLDYAETLIDIDLDHIGILGHSEGGMIAPMIAARNNKVDFIITLAGPALPIAELMVQQNIDVSRSNGLTDEGARLMQEHLPQIFDIINQDEEPSELFDTLINACHTFYDKLSPDDQQLVAPSKQLFYFGISQVFVSPWMRYFFAYDPTISWENVNCPVLALFGSKDIQVAAQANNDAVRFLTQANPNVQLRIFDGYNHLFQKCIECTVAEYATIETTIEPDVLERVLAFVLGL